MNNILSRVIKATYQGPDHPAFDKELEVEIKLDILRKTGEMEVFHNDGKTSIRYPSKKKFLEQWRPEEGWERSATIYKMPQREQRKKEADITIADAGAVIYTEVVAAINRFNGRMVKTYEGDQEWRRPKFEVRLEQQVYPEEIQESQNLYGAGVLILEITQFGLKRVIFQEGVSFTTERDLGNINGYAPKLYMTLLDSLVESALLYAIALNPDDPDNLKVIDDAVKEKEAADTPTIGE